MGFKQATSQDNLLELKKKKSKRMSYLDMQE